MKEEVCVNEKQQWEVLLKKVLSRETIAVNAGVTLVTMAVLKGDICDITLPGLDMF